MYGNQTVRWLGIFWVVMVGERAPSVERLVAENAAGTCIVTRFALTKRTDLSRFGQTVYSLMALLIRAPTGQHLLFLQHAFGYKITAVGHRVSDRIKGAVSVHRCCQRQMLDGVRYRALQPMDKTSPSSWCARQHPYRRLRQHQYCPVLPSSSVRVVSFSSTPFVVCLVFLFVNSQAEDIAELVTSHATVSAVRMRFPANRRFVFDVALDDRNPEVSARASACVSIA